MLDTTLDAPVAESYASAENLGALDGAVAAVAPSPGLCRLFNAAAMDSGFCAWLLAAPAQAATAAARNAGAALGCSHGDPVLALPPLPLTAAELALVGRARGARSLGEAWRRIAVAQAAPDGAEW